MQYKDLGNSINAIAEISKIQGILSNLPDGLPKLAESNRLFESLSSNYSTEVLKLASAHVTLTEQQAITLFSSKGLKDAELAQAVATATLSASEAAATGTTAGLSTAFQGLAASLGLSTVALGALIAGAAVIGIVAVGCRQYAKHLEEIRQKTAEAADVYKDSSSSVEEYASRYQSLHSALLAAKGDEEKPARSRNSSLNSRQNSMINSVTHTAP